MTEEIHSVPRTSGFAYKTIPERLSCYRVALSNAVRCPEILARLVSFGYGRERIAVGTELLEMTESAQADLLRECGEKLEAIDSVEIARRHLQALYGVHLGVARIALRGDCCAEKALCLRGRREGNHILYANQADIFYTNLVCNPGWKAALALFGQDNMSLKKGREVLEIYKMAIAKQDSEMAEAQDFTVKRDSALDKIESWMADFEGIARIALTDTPQHLDVLGIPIAQL